MNTDKEFQILEFGVLEFDNPSSFEIQNPQLDRTRNSMNAKLLTITLLAGIGTCIAFIAIAGADRAGVAAPREAAGRGADNPTARSEHAGLCESH